jgi:hypothetical protein
MGKSLGDELEFGQDEQEPDGGEFKDVSFDRILRSEYLRGILQGQKDRLDDLTYPLRKRVQNQRRELRRLNKQLQAIMDGVKLANHEARKTFKEKTNAV